MKNISYKTVSLSASLTIVAFAAVAHAQMSSDGILTPVGAPVTLISEVASACPAVTGFMKLGAANKPAEVAKLQNFLHNQGLETDVTGIFDQKTEDAVRTFQRAHMSEVMGPWGATRPSGIVYITTAKKINQIACGAPLVLDPTELTVISGYKEAAAAAETQQAAVDATGAEPVELESEFLDQAAAAGVGGASIFGRFMQFLRSAF